MKKAEGKEFKSREEMIQFAKDNAKVYACIAPTLNEAMQPKFELRILSECPNEDKCGDCDSCEFMINVVPGEDGEIFAHGIYTLACAF